MLPAAVQAKTNVKSDFIFTDFLKQAR